MKKDIYLVLYKKQIIGIFFDKTFALDYLSSLYENVDLNNEYLDWEKVNTGFLTENSMFGTLYYGGFEV